MRLVWGLGLFAAIAGSALIVSSIGKSPLVRKPAAQTYADPDLRDAVADTPAAAPLPSVLGHIPPGTAAAPTVPGIPAPAEGDAKAPAVGAKPAGASASVSNPAASPALAGKSILAIPDSQTDAPASRRHGGKHHRAEGSAHEESHGGEPSGMAEEHSSSRGHHHAHDAGAREDAQERGPSADVAARKGRHHVHAGIAGSDSEASSGEASDPTAGAPRHGGKHGKGRRADADAGSSDKDGSADGANSSRVAHHGSHQGSGGKGGGSKTGAAKDGGAKSDDAADGAKSQGGHDRHGGHKHASKAKGAGKSAKKGGDQILISADGKRVLKITGPDHKAVLYDRTQKDGKVSDSPLRDLASGVEKAKFEPGPDGASKIVLNADDTQGTKHVLYFDANGNLMKGSDSSAFDSADTPWRKKAADYSQWLAQPAASSIP